MTDPNQMDIFDVLGDDTPPVPVASTVIKTTPQTSEKGQIRLNEHHFDKKMVGKAFLDWIAATEKQVGDLFTIDEFRKWYKEKGR